MSAYIIEFAPRAGGVITRKVIQGETAEVKHCITTLQRVIAQRDNVILELERVH